MNRRKMRKRNFLVRYGCTAGLLTVVIILANSTAAIAQTDSLSINRALEIAHLHNLQLRIAENGMQSATLSRDELLTTKLPQLSFEGSAIYAPSSNHFGYRSEEHTSELQS